MSVECWEGTESYDWCSVTSWVNVTISRGNDPRVIKEPVSYNQTGFIIMESRLPHCAVDHVTCRLSLSLSLSQFANFSDLVWTVVHEVRSEVLLPTNHCLVIRPELRNSISKSQINIEAGNGVPDMTSSNIDDLRNLSNWKRLIWRFHKALIFLDKCIVYITQCELKSVGWLYSVVSV